MNFNDYQDKCVELYKKPMSEFELKKKIIDDMLKHTRDVLFKRTYSTCVKYADETHNRRNNMNVYPRN